MEAPAIASFAGKGLTRAASLLLLAIGAGCAPAGGSAEFAWQQCEAGGPASIAACSRVIDDTETTPERRTAALIARGVLRAQLGHSARAVADFGRALRIDRRNAQAYLERGTVRQNRGAYDSALRDFDVALRLQPNMQQALTRREEALQGRTERYRRNLSDLTTQLIRDPRNAALLNNRCWLRAVEGEELSIALADCNAALAIDPESGPALDSRGLVHWKRGDYEASLADYEAALALESENGHYLYGRGIARARLGDLAAAQEDFIAAESAEPGVAELYRSYGVDF